MREAARNKSFLRRLREEEKAKAPEIIPEPRPRKKKKYTRKPQIGGYREIKSKRRCPSCLGTGNARNPRKYSFTHCLICNGTGYLWETKEVPFYCKTARAKRKNGN